MNAWLSLFSPKRIWKGMRWLFSSEKLDYADVPASDRKRSIQFYWKYLFYAESLDESGEPEIHRPSFFSWLFSAEPIDGGVIDIEANAAPLSNYFRTKGRSPMEHAKHLVRAILLILVVLCILELFRQSMRPESYGQSGPFREVAMKEKTALPIVYQDKQLCISCHESKAKTVLASKHGVIDCQICHAPLGRHAAEGAKPEEKNEDMAIDRSPELCLRCHQKLTARPEAIKQIDFSKHMIDNELKEELVPGLCLECHSSHEPDL
ncbi:MAG: hypothetical protein AB1656_07500 [Candidatus Omnitrophota bacterium]